MSERRVYWFMSNERLRISIYGLMMIMIVIDRTAIGAGLFIILMGVVMAE